MIKVGLTGNRFSGKDTVCKLFEQIGVPVFNADIVLKFILNYNYEINYKIRSTFGDVFCLKGELLDISKFSEKRKFDDLIDIVEYELLNAYELFNKKHKGKLYTIFHSSILMEREWQKVMDYNISVYSSREERKLRAKRVSGMAEGIINNMMCYEMDDIVKNSLSEYIISNYPSAHHIYGDICEQVNKIDQAIIDRYLLDEQTDILSRHYGEDINPELV